MSLNVDVSVDTTANLGPKVREGVMEWVGAGADRGFAEYLEQMPVDRGNMQQNSYSPERVGNGFRYGTRNIPYAKAQDEGTGPIPNLPLQPLMEWGERVRNDAGFGAAVAQKIRKEGIEPKHFSRDARAEQVNWYNSHPVEPYIERRLR